MSHETLDPVIAALEESVHGEESTKKIEDAFPPIYTPLTKDTRTEARLCAIQAMFQVFLMEKSSSEVLREFVNYRIKKQNADKKLFSLIFSEVNTNLERYTALVRAHLTEGWSMERIGSVQKAILVCAMAELSVQAATPVKAILEQYVTIAASYVEEDEHKFIAAVINTAARKIRPEEFEGEAKTEEVPVEAAAVVEPEAEEAPKEVVEASEDKEKSEEKA
jgi:N utilization substance protein B